MRIPEHKVEEVKAAADIVDVVSDYVRLKRAGSNFKGLCPFHDEKTPSFNVNPGLGIFKCFGCGEGGDVIAFVEKSEHLGFVEAVRLLAERAGIELPDEGPSDGETDESEAIHFALRFAARFYFEQLTQSDRGRARGLAYLRERGFSADTIRRFGLGYAPDAWDGLLKAATAQHVRPEILEKAGLVLPRKQGDGHYDRFRDRVVFPIISHVGKVLGFGGRLLDKDSDQPKYINSPETRVYHKGRVLYGLYQARQAIRGEEEVLLVEGYTDVISLHQAGVEHVVAASGTALTAEHVKLLARYARRVVLLFDADSAGAAAAMRSIDVVLEQGLAPYVITLPENADPDSFVRQFGGEAFRRYAREERQSFVMFQAVQARRAGKLSTPEGQVEVTRAILQSIARLPRDPSYYMMWEGYVRQAAQHLGVPDMHLRAQFPDLVRRSALEPRPSSSAPRRGPSPPQRPSGEGGMRPEEGVLLRLMLEHGLPMVEFVLGHMSLGEFSHGGVRELVERILTQYEEGHVDAKPFTRGEYGEACQRIAAEVLIDRHAASVNWERQHNIRVPAFNEDPYEAAASAMTLLKLDRVSDKITECQHALFAAEQAGENTREHLETVQHLHELRSRIERREFLTKPDAAPE